jgi:hypothetical protein
MHTFRSAHGHRTHRAMKLNLAASASHLGFVRRRFICLQSHGAMLHLAFPGCKGRTVSVMAFQPTVSIDRRFLVPMLFPLMPTKKCTDSLPLRSSLLTNLVTCHIVVSNLGGYIGWV